MIGKKEGMGDRCQKPEVRPARNALATPGIAKPQPSRTGLRGGRGFGDGRTDGVDLLEDRVAEVVRFEVLKFFESGHC